MKKFDLQGVLTALAVFLPLALIAKYHRDDLPLPEDARVGFPRFLGVPVTLLCYFSWAVLPLVSSPGFRAKLRSSGSIALLVVIFCFAFLGWLGGNLTRSVVLDVQLWLGLFAGLGLAYTVFRTRVAIEIHILLIAWCLAMAAYSLYIRAEGLALGTDRIIEPIAFHYLGLLIALVGMLPIWRARLPVLTLAFGVAVSISLIAVSAFIVVGRAFTITFSVLLISLCVCEYYFGKRRGGGGLSPKVQKTVLAFMLFGVFVLMGTLINSVIKNSTMLDRFTSDSYSVDENSRLVELVETANNLTGVQWLFGGGLGYTTAGVTGGGLGLHIGILTFVVKFGLPLGGAFVFMILYYITRSLLLIFRAGGGVGPPRGSLLVFPAAVSLFVVSCLSGGYYEFGFVMLGYLYGAAVLYDEPQNASKGFGLRVPRRRPNAT